MPSIRRVYVACICATMLWSNGVSANSDEAQCVQLRKQNKYTATARCYDQLVKATGIPKDLITKIQMGEWLRRAADNWLRVANQQACKMDATHYKKMAHARYTRYLQDKLYDTKTSRLSAQRKLHTLRVSKATITLHIKVLLEKGALISVKGCSVKPLTKKGQRWDLALPPGSYRVTATFSDGRSVSKTLLHLTQSPPTIILRVPAPTKESTKRKVPAPSRQLATRKAPTPPLVKIARPAAWPLVLSVVGGTLMLLGGGSLALGYGHFQNERNRLYEQATSESQRTVALSLQIQEQERLGNISVVAGFGAIGLGSALLLTGLVAWVQAKPKQPKQ